MLSFLNAVGRTRRASLIGATPFPAFSLPPYFPWSPEFQIFEHEDNTYSADYNPLSDKPSGTTLTVDPSSGDDTSGDGSTGAPYKSIAKAYSEGADIINVKSGWIDADTGFANSFNIGRDLALVAIDGPGTVHLTRSAPQGSITWTPESAPNDDVYRAVSITGTRTALDLDYGRDGSNAALETQKDGSSPVPIPYSEQTSIADVQANAGSFYDDGIHTYLHTHNSRAPDGDVKLLKAENILYITNDITLYIDGIEIWGDGSMTINPGSNATAKFIGVDMACRFGNNSADCFSFDNILAVRLKNCSATDNFLADGFGYNRSYGVSAAPTSVLEWNCDGRRNGISTSNNDNGSTTHLGVHCIRLNGVYEFNNGPNVADTSGSHTLNLNCFAGNSDAFTLTQRGGFLAGTYWSGLPAIVYLKNCQGDGNRYDRVRGTGGQMLDLGGFSGTSNDSGSILDGTDPFYMAIGAVAPDAINGFFSVLQSSFFFKLSGGAEQIFDASPQKNTLTTPAGRPFYDAANALAGGLPAMDFGAALNSDYLQALLSTTYKDIILIAAYKDGSDDSFDDDITILESSSSDPLIMGGTGTADLSASGSFASTASKNGGSSSVTVLPSGFAAYRFTAASPVTDTFRFLGSAARSNAGWQGPVAAVICSNRDLTSLEFDAILSAAETKFSIA